MELIGEFSMGGFPTTETTPALDRMGAGGGSAGGHALPPLDPVSSRVSRQSLSVHIDGLNVHNILIYMTLAASCGRLHIYRRLADSAAT